MSFPATEIAIIPLSSGASIEDPLSPLGEIWQSCLGTIAGQKGFRRLYWGRRVESSNVIDFFVGKLRPFATLGRDVDSLHTSDWDSVQAHKDFIANPVYESFSESFSKPIEGNSLIYHLLFSPNPPSSALNPASSLVAEHLTFYFSSTLPDSGMSSWEDTFAKFKKALEQHAEGFKAGSGGWIIEELQHEKVEGNAKAYAAVFQWESVEKHKMFRDTEDFKKAIGPVREASRAIEMHHVILREF
ncbi:hypothetical protein MMC22_005962 [Lobaria immixta]|nr:hypothetical protein [Lobaria immixta]